MKKLLILGGAVGLIWYFSRKPREDRQPELQQVGDLELPVDADLNVAAVQDLINVIENWILQAAGDVSAYALGQSLPGPMPATDFFIDPLPITGEFDLDTRWHLARIKTVIGKTGLEPALINGLNLRAFLLTDLGVEDDPVVLYDVLYPIFEDLAAIGGTGYPTRDEFNMAYWTFYTAVGNAYWAALSAGDVRA